MTTLIRIFVTFLLALTTGAVVGWTWLSAGHRPPPLDPSQAVVRGEPHAAQRVIPAEDLGRAPRIEPPPVQREAADVAPAAAQKSATRGGRAADPTDNDERQVLVPAETDKQRDGDVDLLPRGPTAWVLVDLSSIGATRLVVRAGSLTRDGAGAWRTFAKRKRVGVLRGSRVRVALLHLGFDRNGRAVVAHIRTEGPPAIEGVIPLLVQDRPLRLRRIAEDSPSSSSSSSSRAAP